MHADQGVCPARNSKPIFGPGSKWEERRQVSSFFFRLLRFEDRSKRIAARGLKAHELDTSVRIGPRDVRAIRRRTRVSIAARLASILFLLD